jgi:hypothetical protein
MAKAPPTASVTGGRGIWRENATAYNPPLGLNPLGWSEAPARLRSRNVRMPIYSEYSLGNEDCSDDSCIGIYL